LGQPVDLCGDCPDAAETRAVAEARVPGGDCNQFQLAARYDQGTFVVDPLTFQAHQSLVSFQGSGNLAALNGQLRVEGIPVELAELVVDLPVAVSGDLTTTAQVTGSLSDPQVVGELAVVDPSLNQQPLEGVGLNFAYSNAVLSFDGAAVVAEPAEITLQGAIPYALPFMTVQPPSDRVDIRVTLKDESLEILNLVTADQLRWEGGQGDITVQVGGTLADPAVAGQAVFQDGQLTSSAISQAVTGLTGRVLFNLDRVQVENLQANFGDGNLAVSGRLPVQAPGPVASLAQTKQAQPTSDQLVIALNQINIDYEGVLEAQIDGNILITGAVLNPVVSGDVQVGNGLVRANNLLAQMGSLPGSELEVPVADSEVTEPLPAYIETFRASLDGFNPPTAPPPALADPLERVRLNDFNVLLTDELIIAGQPFYYLNASGNILLNGTAKTLQPNGVITLDTGWINLFSTQFRLVSDAANTATFFPESGLDPFLDVEMRARLQDADVTQVASTTPFTSAEITDNSGVSTFGQVEFVTVFATAYGYASQLQNSETPQPGRGPDHLDQPPEPQPGRSAGAAG
jgi:translocation and assembly module TamB